MAIARSRARLRLGGALLGARGRQLVAHHVAARLLERAVERRLEQVRIVEIGDVAAAHDPQPDALLPSAEQLAGVVQCELASGAMTLPPWRIGSPSFSWRKTSKGSRSPAAERPRLEATLGEPSAVTRPGGRGGAASSVSRTQAVSSWVIAPERDPRPALAGPWPVTTFRSSAQSGSV